MALIKNYEDYDITESGEVISNKYNKQRVLKLQKATQSKKGYYQVRLFNEFTPGGRLHYVHRLVWEAFGSEIPKGMEIDHKDGDTSNNHIDNLQLITKKHNQLKHLIDTLGYILRDRRDEIIEDYLELGSFKKVAEKWNASQIAIYRIIKNKITARVNGKLTLKTIESQLNDEWTNLDLRKDSVRKKVGLPKNKRKSLN